jgi:hypothetical protein
MFVSFKGKVTKMISCVFSASATYLFFLLASVKNTSNKNYNLMLNKSGAKQFFISFYYPITNTTVFN